MKNFRIQVRSSVFGTLHITAESEEEAKRLAQTGRNKHQIDFDADTADDIEIEEVERTDAKAKCGGCSWSGYEEELKFSCPKADGSPGELEECKDVGDDAEPCCPKCLSQNLSYP